MGFSLGIGITISDLLCVNFEADVKQVTCSVEMNALTNIDSNGKQNVCLFHFV